MLLFKLQTPKSLINQTHSSKKNQYCETIKKKKKSNKKPSNNHHSKINQNQIQTANTQNPSTHSEINQITLRNQPKTNKK
jgi:hypothetical protein